MRSVSWAEVRARRLERQSLIEPVKPRTLVSLVRDTCGIHAQVTAAAELSLSARVGDLTQQEVRDALWADRSLVKAWTIRGTLHLHPAAELPLWYAARRAIGGDSSADTDLGRGQVTEIHEAIRDALDGRCLLREELADEVVRRVGPAPEERLRSGWAFFLDEVCQGPPQGNKVTFVRPDQWIEGWRDVDEQEALREVARRYLRAYGPARPSDFRQWFTSRQFKPSDARRLFESLDDELEEVDIEEHPAYVLAGDSDFPDPRGSLKLLPEYDVYVMGFRERDQLVPPDARARLFDHARGKYEGPAGVRWLAIDGLAAGLWERKKRSKCIELSVEPFHKLTRAQRKQLDGEAERIGAFLGLDPVLTLE